MFLKPFRIKSNVAVRGSERKKLRAELARQFPTFPDTQWSEVIPNKEDFTLMKICSHSGEHVTVYCLRKNPAFFETEKVLYPTVYTLWQWPDLLASFTTWPPVFKKLTGGADLMLPGVVTSEPHLPQMLNNISKGTPCSVKLLGNRAPVAVGMTAMSGADMIDSGFRGKGVLVLHSYQDQLWAAGDKSHPPQLDEPVTAEDISGQDMEVQGQGEEVIGQDAEVTGEEVSQQSAEVTDNTPEAVAGMGELSLGSEDLKEAEVRREEREENDATSSQDDMDQLLMHCLLCAIKSKLQRSELPMETSTFYNTHMMPFCPADQPLNIKRSSYKKLSRFLRCMQERGLVVVDDVGRGIERIVDFDKKHSDLRGFEATEVQSKETEEGDDVGPCEAPPISEVFMASSSMLPLLKLSGHKKGDYFTASQVKTLVTDYIKSENLQHQTDKRLVMLDPVLSQVLLHKSESLESLVWEEVFSRALSSLNSAHLIHFPGQDPVLKKGKLECVTLNIAQRAGNKKVTLVQNLENVGLDPQEFSHRVQLTLACSTSVSQLPGKNRGLEVHIQGNQLKQLVKILTETYKVDKKYILVPEKSKMGKKK